MVVNNQLQIQYAKSVPMTIISALLALTEERFFFDGTVYLGGSLWGDFVCAYLQFVSRVVVHVAFDTIPGIHVGCLPKLCR